MKFSVQAQTHPTYLNYRLQKNRGWKSIEINEPIVDGDLVFKDPYDARRECDSWVDRKIKLKGAEYVVDPSMGFFFGSYAAFLNPHVQRYEKPRRFYRSELRSVIAAGDDTRFNSLVLDLYGNFKLLDFRDVPDIRKNPEIAVRHETFVAGNDYVGPEAAKDDLFLDETYLAMLGGWAEHLRTGEINLYINLCTGKTEDEMWKEVEMLTLHLE